MFSVSYIGRFISEHTNLVFLTSVSILDEYAAPVANIIDSVIAGDAKLNLDKAPSTIVISVPKRRLFSIVFFRVWVSAAPESNILPLPRALAVTNLPRIVYSSEISRISAEKRFFRKYCSAVLNIIPLYILISGFDVCVTASTVSPSIPIDVTAIVLPQSFTRRMIKLRVSVLPVFFSSPTIDMLRYCNILFIKFIIISSRYYHHLL